MLLISKNPFPENPLHGWPVYVDLDFLALHMNFRMTLVASVNRRYQNLVILLIPNHLDLDFLHLAANQNDDY